MIVITTPRREHLKPSLAIQKIRYPGSRKALGLGREGRKGGGKAPKSNLINTFAVLPAADQPLQFNHSLTKYLLKAYCIQSIMLGAGEDTKNKLRHGVCLQETLQAMEICFA